MNLLLYKPYRVQKIYNWSQFKYYEGAENQKTLHIFKSKEGSNYCQTKSEPK